MSKLNGNPCYSCQDISLKTTKVWQSPKVRGIQTLGTMNIWTNENSLNCNWFISVEQIWLPYGGTRGSMRITEVLRFILRGQWRSVPKFTPNVVKLQPAGGVKWKVTVSAKSVGFLSGERECVSLVVVQATLLARLTLFNLVPLLHPFTN